MPDYRVRMTGPGKLMTEIVLECESDAQAMRIACAIDSPFGHELRAGPRFLGRFESGWGVDFPEVPPEKP